MINPQTLIQKYSVSKKMFDVVEKVLLLKAGYTKPQDVHRMIFRVEEFAGGKYTVVLKNKVFEYTRVEPGEDEEVGPGIYLFSIL